MESLFDLLFGIFTTSQSTADSSATELDVECRRLSVMFNRMFESSTSDFFYLTV